MQNISKYILKYGMLLTIILSLVQSACKKESAGAPVITEIRAYLATPNDTVLKSCKPGDWIVLLGSNLASVKTVAFNGTAGTLNTALFTNNSLIVQVPSDIPFGDLQEGKLNTIDIANDGGSLTLSFKIDGPVPVIESVSNEMAYAGEVVTLTGTGLYQINKIVFPGGVEATEYTSIASGTSITVKVPQITQSGSITLETSFGTGEFAFFNNQTGMKCNFDDVNNQDAWDNLVSNDAVAFPGNRGNYGRFKFESCPASDWGDWQTGRGIRTKQVQWVPVENLDDPTSDWAVKFEIYVKNAWSDGCIFIHDWSWKKTCRYEPWDTEGIKPYSTAGWKTVVLPLSMFKSKANDKDGTGDAASTVRGLLENDWNGSDGNKWMVFLFDNPTAEVKDFDAAIDNIRVVKIKNGD
jgi:hypothetical protein